MGMGCKLGFSIVLFTSFCDMIFYAIFSKYGLDELLLICCVAKFDVMIMF